MKNKTTKQTPAGRIRDLVLKAIKKVDAEKTDGVSYNSIIVLIEPDDVSIVYRPLNSPIQVFDETLIGGKFERVK